MPLVGMRRRTRVFGTRVLRSGRRLWSGQSQGKHVREAVDTGAGHGELWIDLFDNSNSGGGRCDNEIQSKVNGRPNDAQDIVEMDIDEPKSVENVDVNDKKWGYVYQRKRKRVDSVGVDHEGSFGKKNRALECRRYGKQFVRKQWRVKKSIQLSACSSTGCVASSERRVLTAVVGSSSSWFAYILTLVWRYMRRTKLKLSQLSTFLLSEPLAHVFSSHGIGFRYVMDSCGIKRSGTWNFYEARSFVPLFAVDFSAAPSCFTYLHSSLHLKTARYHPAVVAYLEAMNDAMNEVVEHQQVPNEVMTEVVGHRQVLNDVMSEAVGHQQVLNNVMTEVVEQRQVLDDVMTEVVEHRQCSSLGDFRGTQKVIPRIDVSEKKMNLSCAVNEVPRSTGRLVQFRNGINFHSSIRKRKRSVRCRRIKSLSVIIHNPDDSNGSSVSSHCESREDSISMTSAVSGKQQRTSLQKGSTQTVKEMKSLLAGLTQDIDSLSCSANVLVIEPHKCYRIKDAIVKLESLPSKQWFIAVKKDEITRYSLSAQKVMRPCSNNRVTHDIIWTDDNNWKLEFLNRLDWMIFKELYKECFDRNLRAPSANDVFVPGVHEVIDHADNSSAPFSRPMLYIRVKDDEVSRALARKTANYDMDFEDEEWLKKLNMELLAQNDSWNYVSEESFELIIDSFEKASYCSPDYLSNEKAQNICLNLERREIVEAIHGYWKEKRKQKGVPLLRVFQPYRASRDRLLSKPVLRKKRSYKHQSSFSGRGKPLHLLQATMMVRNGVEHEVTTPFSPRDEKPVEAKHSAIRGRETRAASAIRYDHFTPTAPFSDSSTSQRTAMARAKETIAAANRLARVAIKERNKVQLRMKNADLATYKASMALRIADASSVAEAAGGPVSSFLPEAYPDMG